MSICKFENEGFLRDFLNFWSWQHQERSKPASLPQLLNLTTSKTKLFCETSSILEVDNIKNKAILRDFLKKWKVECRADGLVPMRFAIFHDFSTPPVYSTAPDMKTWCQVIRSAAPVTQNHLTKPGKTHSFATFLPFRTPASSFFWLFLFSDLLSSALLVSDSSHLCFSICPYCRKFDV